MGFFKFKACPLVTESRSGEGNLGPTHSVNVLENGFCTILHEMQAISRAQYCSANSSVK